jgi:uncharacterized protein (DUF983 family)
MSVPSFDQRPDAARTGFMAALKRGLRRRCPACGHGRLFAGYLTMNGHCNSCGQDFEPCRADDAPAYFTILLVGHIVVPGILVVEQWAQPAVWLQLAVWLPVTLIATLALLPYIKGATIGAVWATRR